MSVWNAISPSDPATPTAVARSLELLTLHARSAAKPVLASNSSRGPGWDPGPRGERGSVPFRRLVLALVSPLPADGIDRLRRRHVGHFQPELLDSFGPDLVDRDGEHLVACGDDLLVFLTVAHQRPH